MPISTSGKLLAALFATAALSLGLGSVATQAAEDAVVIPAPAIDEAGKSGTETAVFAGGCFWGVQGVFQHVKGVKSAISGYAGGEAATAQYETVSTGTTGHAESVKVTFDPKQVSYGKLLQVFFSVAHNPTQLNFQGPDEGTQYRSALFISDQEQRKVAESLYRPARQGACLQTADRHQGHRLYRLLPGRAVSPGFPDAQPDLPLYRL